MDIWITVTILVIMCTVAVVVVMHCHTQLATSISQVILTCGIGCLVCRMG